MHARALTWLVFVALVAVCPAPLATAASPEAGPTHTLEADDYFTQAWLRESIVSPDGKWVAYADARWNPDTDKRDTELWVVSTRTRAPQRITFDGRTKYALSWTPDSQFILFEGGRKQAGAKGAPWNGKSQVWRVPVTGGEPTPLTRVADGVGLYELSADGQALYYTTAEKTVAEPWKDLKSAHSDPEYGHGVVRFSKVWELDLQTWRTRQLTDEERVITDLAVSHDRRRVAMITKPDETLLTGEGWSRVDILDVAKETITTATPDGWRTSHASPRGWVEDLEWSSDDELLAFSISFDGYQTELWVTDPRDPATLRQIARPSHVTVAGGALRWRGTSRDLCFKAEEKARRRVYCVAKVTTTGEGALQTLTPGDVVVSHFSHDAAGKTLVATFATPTATADIHLIGRGGRATRLTRANPQTADWILPQLSIVSWNAPDGTPVEGILELPPGYDPAEHGPIPMITIIHGGPTAAALYYFRFFLYGRGLLAARGYATLSPNYRGSTGYGDAFMTELIGRENDVEVLDILAGVDAMVARGIADPNKLGVMGWSNGGYLTNCLISRTTRFKAASSGAGVLDQVMQWGIEDTPGHVINYMEGLPWDRPKAYAKGSPLYNLDKVTTPTLIHVGENDARVPVEHARTLHRALHVYLDVPTELLVYPGEGHGIGKYKHRKAKLAWDHAWFERYLGPGWTPPQAP